MGATIYIVFSFFSFCECVCVCFCVRFCLYSFPSTICPKVLSVRFFNFFLLIFFILIILLYFIFILFYLLSFFPSPSFPPFFLSFSLSTSTNSFFLLFLPFILSRVDERLLVLQPGVSAVPLRWESQLHGPQETSQLHVISNGENVPEISISTPRPSSTQ